MKRLRSPGSSQPIDLTDPGTHISLLEHQWEGFCDQVMPMAASQVQRDEAKRAFFAGAQGVLNALQDALDDGLPPEEAGKVLPAIGVEVERFAAAVSAQGQAARMKGKEH